MKSHGGPFQANEAVSRKAQGIVKASAELITPVAFTFPDPFAGCDMGLGCERLFTSLSDLPARLAGRSSLA